MATGRFVSWKRLNRVDKKDLDRVTSYVDTAIQRVVRMIGEVRVTASDIARVQGSVVVEAPSVTFNDPVDSVTLGAGLELMLGSRDPAVATGDVLHLTADETIAGCNPSVTHPSILVMARAAALADDPASTENRRYWNVTATPPAEATRVIETQQVRALEWRVELDSTDAAAIAVAQADGWQKVVTLANGAPKTATWHPIFPEASGARLPGGSIKSVVQFAAAVANEIRLMKGTSNWYDALTSGTNLVALRSAVDVLLSWDADNRLTTLEGFDAGTRLDVIDAENGAGDAAEIPGMKSHATNTGAVSTAHTRVVLGSINCDSQADMSASVASSGCIARALSGPSAHLASTDCTTGSAIQFNLVTIASNRCRVEDGYSAAIGCLDSATKGLRTTIVASRNIENATDNSLALGYDAGAAITPNGTDQNLTIKLAANGGNGTCDGSWTGGGADYAEFFENADPGEIGACLLVARQGRHVRPASEGDRILGVVSPNPGVVGNAAGLQWQGRKKRDELGRVLTREVECVRFGHKPEPVVETPKGIVAKIVKAAKKAAGKPEPRPPRQPHYDGPAEHCKHPIPADAERYTVTTYQEVEGYERGRKYLPRSERPTEWTCVGLMGQLRVRVDATVTDATEFIAPVKDGIGGHSDAATNCEVMEILTPFDAAKGYGVALCFVR